MTICGEKPDFWVTKMRDLDIPIGDISDFANKVEIRKKSTGSWKVFSLDAEIRIW